MQKQFRTLLFCLALLLAGPGDLSAQTLNVLPSQVYRGQVVTLYVSGTNVDFSTASSCRIYQGGNPSTGYERNIDVINTTELYSTFILSTNAGLGLYDLDIVDFFSSPTLAPNALTILDPPATAGQISGAVQRNSTCNFNGTRLANRLVQINPGGYLTVTDGNGQYAAFVPAGATYTVTVSPGPIDSLICPQTPMMVTVANPGQILNSNNFTFDVSNATELEPHFANTIHRPGFSATNTVSVKNNGGAPASNVEVKIAIPAWLNYSSNNVNATFANDTITWNIPALPATTDTNMVFTVSIPALNTLGLIYTYSVEVESASPDAFPNNNSYSRSDVVLGSYDPNDKQVWTQDDVNADGPINPSDSTLRYLVRFQNTGTDTAFTVRINDVFDANLDISTLEMINASHSYAMEVINNNEINFLFPNIFLPDSNTNEPLSHGFIEFSLKLKPGLPLGTEIDNEANIYFDFNLPVLTNTVTSKICPEVNLDFSFLINSTTMAFTDQSTGNLTALTWDFGDGNTSTAASPSHTYAVDGTYTICLSMTDTCGLRSVCKTITTSTVSATSPQDDQPHLALYPNPNSGQFTLEAELLAKGKLNWKIMDLSGRTLHEMDEGSVSGIWKREIDMQELPAGSYILQLELNGQRSSRVFQVK